MRTSTWLEKLQFGPGMINEHTLPYRAAKCAVQADDSARSSSKGVAEAARKWQPWASNSQACADWGCTSSSRHIFCSNTWSSQLVYCCLDTALPSQIGLSRWSVRARDTRGIICIYIYIICKHECRYAGCQKHAPWRICPQTRNPFGHHVATLPCGRFSKWRHLIRRGASDLCMQAYRKASLHALERFLCLRCVASMGVGRSRNSMQRKHTCMRDINCQGVSNLTACQIPRIWSQGVVYGPCFIESRRASLVMQLREDFLICAISVRNLLSLRGLKAVVSSD